MENGKYLTYEEFIGLGGTLDIVPFNLFELEARNCINRETLGRLINKQEQCEAVKVCMFKLIQGFSIDANYLDANTEEREKYITKIIYTTLSNVIVDGEAILYRGI